MSKYEIFKKNKILKEQKIHRGNTGTEYKNGTGKWKKKIMPSDEVRVDFVILFLLVMYFIADIYLKTLLKFISKNDSCIK